MCVCVCVLTLRTTGIEIRTRDGAPFWGQHQILGYFVKLLVISAPNAQTNKLDVPRLLWVCGMKKIVRKAVGLQFRLLQCRHRHNNEQQATTTARAGELTFYLSSIAVFLFEIV